MTSPELKIRQFRHESDTWKRNLEFMMQENVNLKNRLAEVLQAISADEDILNAAEHYQNEFIREDEAIHLLRRDISKLDTLLVREIYEDGELVRDLVHQHRKLSQEVRNAVSEFNKLKFDFNNYLGEVL
ncbi:MAG TPA: hypothetical protein VHD35_15605 [Chitinophagaceae bacterium]|nr:hypothetical protein [Chitinophagaceae bacterium]